ncbi:MAG: phosphatidate cytidylyltransferase [Planctomycetota bacterium]
MKTRILLGSLIVGAIAGVFCLDTMVFERAIATRVLIWLLALGTLKELLQILGKRLECAPGLFATGGVAVTVVLVPAFLEGRPVDGTLLALAALMAGAIRLLVLAPVRSAPVAFPEAAGLSAAILYSCGLLSFLDRIAVAHIEAVYVVVAISKSSDICAYFAGRFLGKRPFAPALSPKKTWEGALFGIAGAAGVAACFPAELAGHDMPAWFAAILGALIGAASMVGDLVASGLKRWASIKDSSSMLPQFGGMLDLVDGVLFAGPVAVVCLMGG